MRLFFPASYFRGTPALTHSAPLREGLTEQWLTENGLTENISCTQVRLLDSVVAGAPRLWPGASWPQKMFARQCSSSISGIMENHNTYLAPPLTTLPQHQRMWPFSGSAGTGWLQQPLPNVLPAVELVFPVWLENLLVPTLFLGIPLFHQSTASYRAAELQLLCSPCLQS